jgi:hypothetical protein
MSFSSATFCKVQPKNGCKNGTYLEVGKTFKVLKKPFLGHCGFHCCSNFLLCCVFMLQDLNENNRYFLVNLGEVVHGNPEKDGIVCSNEMFIKEEVTLDQVLQTFNRQMLIESIKLNPLTLKYIPENLKTFEICFLAVVNYGLTLEFVPESLKGGKMCFLAVGQHGRALEFVPEQFKYFHICLKAMEKHKSNVKHVPECLKNKCLEKINK